MPAAITGTGTPAAAPTFAVIARRRSRRGDLALALATGLSLFAFGCRQDMHDQPKYEPLEASHFFADGMASRQLPEGTVARGHLAADTVFHTGKDAAGNAVAELPMPVTKQLLQRGHERFNVFCSPCHGRLGDGQGMVARRGFKQPPSFHEDRLRSSPVGYYVDVMTHGFGVMPSYAVAIPPEDRWAIAAYLRALQLSQRAHLAELPPDVRAAVEAAATAGAAPAAEAHEGAPH